MEPTGFWQPDPIESVHRISSESGSRSTSENMGINWDPIGFRQSESYRISSESGGRNTSENMGINWDLIGFRQSESYRISSESGSRNTSENMGINWDPIGFRLSESYRIQPVGMHRVETDPIESDNPLSTWEPVSFVKHLGQATEIIT